MGNWKQGQGEEWKREQRVGGRGQNGQQKLGIRVSIVMEAMAKQGATATGAGNLTTCYTAEDGTLRMKIRVKKQDLKQILALGTATGNLIIPHNNNNNNNNNNSTSTSANAAVATTASVSTTAPSPSPSPSSMERRLYDLKIMRRRRLRPTTHGHAIKGIITNSFTWRPALQSIPE